MPAVGQMALDVKTSASALAEAGLGNADRDRLLEHNTHPDAMWLSKKEAAGEGVVFEFDAARTLEKIAVWNYNLPNYTGRGVGKTDISVWTEQGGWKSLLKGVELAEAEGTPDYDDPTIISFKPMLVQKVRFENLVPIRDEGFVGLSEVRFFEPFGPAASNPEPMTAEVLPAAGQVKVQWMPGQGAEAHDIYAGTSPKALTLLGRTEQLEATLSGLVHGTRYYWRIDEVDDKGKVTQGKVWDFGFEDGRLAAGWTFDQVEDGRAADTAGTFAAVLQAGTQWVEQEGGRTGVIELDGEKGFVQADPLKLNTHSATITLWLRSNGVQNAYTGLVFCRGGKTVSGLNFKNDNELGYHWDDQSTTWQYESGLIVPQDKWVFAALSVRDDRAILYLMNEGELKAAVHDVAHAAEPFDAPLTIGKDPESSSNRHFRGWIDDVRIYNYALDEEQIRAVADNKPFAAARAAAMPVLINTKLIGAGQAAAPNEPQAETQAEIRAEASAEKPASRRSVWPVMVIVALIAAVVVATQVRKK
jgi:hypothetical protein